MTTGNVIGEYSLVTRSPMAHSVRAFTQLKVYNSMRLLSLLFSLPPFNCAFHRELGRGMRLAAAFYAVVGVHVLKKGLSKSCYGQMLTDEV